MRATGTVFELFYQKSGTSNGIALLSIAARESPSNALLLLKGHQLRIAHAINSAIAADSSSAQQNASSR